MVNFPVVRLVLTLATLIAFGSHSLADIQITFEESAPTDLFTFYHYQYQFVSATTVETAYRFIQQ